MYLNLKPEYLAGLFDGEGCVHAGFYRNKFILSVSIGMTGEAAWHILREVKEMYGGSLWTGDNGKLATKPLHKLTLRGKAIDKFLNAIRPYSVVKAAEIDVALKGRAKLHSNIHKRKFDPRVEYAEIYEELRDRK